MSLTSQFPLLGGSLTPITTLQDPRSLRIDDVDSLGFSLIYIDLGVLQDITFDIEISPTGR